jgi:hypothetical protein
LCQPNADSYGDSYSYCHADGDSNIHANRDGDSNGDRDGYCHANSDDPAEAYTDAQTASDASASSVALTGTV